MKKSVLLVVAIFAAAGSASSSAARPQREKGAYDPNEMVCMRFRETGSRLVTRRVCMTQQEWAELRRETRQSIDRAQVSRGHPY